ncbi:MAG: class I SAM-dependent methyltransferase [Chloroflexota bacterium]|nr:class I SAM-dependent methyltransferase [Chloroflexota bacterium]
MTEVKQEVRQFYDHVGWQIVSDDVYQNARYEDLRPVSLEYIRRCHLRVNQHLKPAGHLLLDAGSGPIQYPEYLEYSRNYQHRVCADISITALREAHKRIRDHGLYVVADIANLPFEPDAFDGVVSLHTIHHLPESEHLNAYLELHRVLEPGGSAVVVNGWQTSRLMDITDPFIHLSNRLRGLIRRLSGKTNPAHPKVKPDADDKQTIQQSKKPKGTYVEKHEVDWVKHQVGAYMPLEILVWRSVSVRFLRSLIHPKTGGRWWLRLLFWLEERFPHFFGEQGKYPLIVIRKGD